MSSPTSRTSEPESSRRAAATSAALATLVLLATSGFFWMRDGSAQSWPVYVLALLLPLYHRRDLLFAGTAASWWLAAVLGWTLLSICWSAAGVAEQARLGAVMLCLYAWLAALAHLCRGPRFWSVYQGVFLVAAALSAVAAVLWLSDSFRQDGRLAGFRRLENYAVAAYVWGGAAIVALRVWLHPAVPRPLRQVAGVLFVVLAAAVLATGTRGGIAVLTLLVALSLVGFGRRWQTLAAAVLLAAAAFLGMVTLLDLPLVSDVPRAVQNNIRLEIWRTTFAGLEPWHWLAGIGIASPARVTLSDGQLFDHVHGLFLSVFVHTGGVGLVLFAALTAHAAASAHRHAGADPAADCALWSLAWMCLTGVLDGSTPFTKVNHLWLLYWAPLAFALYGSRRIRSG